MATATQIEEFRAASNTLVDLALNDLLAMWRPFVLRATPSQARETLLAVMPDLVASYGQTAAVLGVDWYDLLRGDVVSAPSASRLGAVPTAEQVQATVRWAVGPLWDGNPESAFSNLSGAMQRLILSGLRDSIDQSARADASTGRVAAVSWARHTRPALARSGRSCDFCVMLAGRGPFYRSAAAAGVVVGRGSTRTGFDDAGNRLGGGIGGGIKARGTQALAATYHDDCHCVAEPTFYGLEDRPLNVRGYTQTVPHLVPLK